MTIDLKEAWLRRMARHSRNTTAGPLDRLDTPQCSDVETLDTQV